MRLKRRSLLRPFVATLALCTHAGWSRLIRWEELLALVAIDVAVH
jgi:hypothetical protein